LFAFVAGDDEGACRLPDALQQGLVTEDDIAKAARRAFSVRLNLGYVAKRV
jgi:hypothetical protein